jgi:hypothetical protein
VAEDQMNLELEIMRAKALQAQQDYEVQLIKVERLTRETSQKAAALKVISKNVELFYSIQKHK